MGTGVGGGTGVGVGTGVTGMNKKGEFMEKIRDQLLDLAGLLADAGFKV